MPCDNQISTQDLINAKSDAVTLGEVATSRTGAESGGAPITQSTNRFGEVTDTIQGRLNKLGVLFDDPIKDWSASLLVSDLRAHRYPATTGDIYIPVKPLPFTTGGTFNSADWELYNGTNENAVKEVIANQKPVFNFATLEGDPASAIESTDEDIIFDGSAIDAGERTTGNGGSAKWDIVLTSSVTPNGSDIVQSNGLPLLSAVLRKQSVIDSLAFGVDSAELQAAVDYMNSNKISLIVNHDLTATNILSTGHTDIVGKGTISQENSAGRGFYVKLSSASAGTYASVSNVALPGGGISVTKLTGTLSAQVGDVVQVVDSAILAGTSNVNFAETATVQAVDGTGVWLDCVLRHFDYFTNGTLYIMDTSKVSINGPTFKATAGAFAGSAARFSAVTIAGAVNPKIDVDVEGDINSGISLRGCYKAKVNLNVKYLRDDSAVSSFGYGVVSYGCCKASDITVNATKVRHAYTDGIWDSIATDSWEKGFTLDALIKGIGMSCSAATWDTHPYSDGAVFQVNKAVEGSSNTAGNKDNAYAYQMRGTNTRIVGGQSNRDKSVFYAAGLTALIDSLDVVEVVEAEEKTQSLTFSFTENISGKVLKLVGRNCKFKGTPFSANTTNIDYVSFENTVFDSQGVNWDPSASKEYNFTFKNCEFIDMPNFRIRNGLYVFEGGKRVSTDNSVVTAIVLFEGAEVRAVNFGADVQTASGRTLFLTEGAATAATKLDFANCYLHQRDGDLTVRIVDLQGSAAVVRDLNATAIVA